MILAVLSQSRHYPFDQLNYRNLKELSYLLAERMNGGFAHPQEDRYEVREGDIIINRCRL